MVWIPLLLVACAVAAVCCARVCRAALAAAGPARVPEAGTAPAGLTLPEAAFLAGGPLRVADLALVSMHRSRRLLLAHTGWATVVDAAGAGDELERAVVRALGPGGQAPVPEARALVAAAACVGRIERELVERGLAVPEERRGEVAAGVRAVRAAFLLTVALGAAAVPLVPEGEREPVVAAFSLPLVASGLCLLIGRSEGFPHTRWASHAGQLLLAGVGGDDPLAALATRGTGALEPALRAAFGGPE